MKFLRTAFLAGIPFGIFMGTFFLFSRGLNGIVFGLLGGVFFGICMALFSSYQHKRFQTERPSFINEELIHEGPANHFFHGEGVGGWLYLTSKRLLFRSHRINRQPHETDLPLAEISVAKPSLTAGIIPNGLLVSTVSGAVERFVVEGQKHWSEAIADAKNCNG